MSGAALYCWSRLEIGPGSVTATGGLGTTAGGFRGPSEFSKKQNNFE